MQLSLLTHSPAVESYPTRAPIPGPATEAAQEITRGRRKAREQEDAILAFFRANPGAWGPSQVWERVGPRGDSWGIERDAEGWPVRMHIGPQRGNPRWLLTSVRRAITNLTERGHLRMTMERRRGPYGAAEHLWELQEGGGE